MQQILKSHRIGQLLMLLILGILGACIFLPGTAPVLSAAPSATKTPVADTYVASGAPNQSFHTEQGLWVGNNRSNSIKIRRTLLKFDLSDIPTGSTITAAALVLNLGGTTTNDGPRNIKVSRIVRDTGGDWLANTTEEMTWDRHLQLEPTDLNSSTISVGTGLTEYQWNLAAMVKDWLNDSSRSQYFGLLVQDTNNSDGQHERAFWAKDCLDSSCSSAQRPRLLVEYTVPTSTPTATPTVGATATPTNTPVPTKPPKPTPGISIARLTNSPSGVISKNDEVLYIITFSSNNVKEFELLDLQIEDTIPANAKLVKDSIESNQFYQVKTTGTNPGDKITWTWKAGFPHDETRSVSYRVVYSPTTETDLFHNNRAAIVPALLQNDGALIRWSYNGEFNSIRSNFICNPACPSQHLPVILQNAARPKQ